MRLHSLVLCSDEKILQVLRRVLGDLEITIDHCTESDPAIHKLTRQRYEAVVVDCANERIASQVLRGARAAPINKHAVAVAILDGDRAMRSAFDVGAHFVLYKPLSTERAKTSFRAVRALMKCERRRNNRLPVEIPVSIAFQGGQGQQRAVASDLGEGGIAIQPAPSGKYPGPMTVSFTLPGSSHKIECVGEIAWSNSSRQAGVRFVDLPSGQRQQLKSWMESQTSEVEKDDPPVACKLTDLSPSAGYLETAAPFPLRTTVTLAIRSAEVQAQIEGIVRVTHPEAGMGVEFLQRTPQQRQQLDEFIQGLMTNPEAIPDILVQPEGLERDEAPATALAPAAAADDPLLGLLRRGASMPADAFFSELRQQRGVQQPA